MWQSRTENCRLYLHIMNIGFNCVTLMALCVAAVATGNMDLSWLKSEPNCIEIKFMLEVLFLAACSAFLTHHVVLWKIVHRFTFSALVFCTALHNNNNGSEQRSEQERKCFIFENICHAETINTYHLLQAIQSKYLPRQRHAHVPLKLPYWGCRWMLEDFLATNVIQQLDPLDQNFPERCLSSRFLKILIDRSCE